MAHRTHILSGIIKTMPKDNKSAQSNLGRGPRRGAVAHVRRKVPIGYNGAPQIRPKSTPSCGPTPKPHYLPHPWTRPTDGAKPHPDPIRRFSTMHWTDRPTHLRTDAQTDRSSTGKFDRYRPLAMRATRPSNCLLFIGYFLRILFVCLLSVVYCNCYHVYCE